MPPGDTPRPPPRGDKAPETILGATPWATPRIVVGDRAAEGRGGPDAAPKRRPAPEPPLSSAIAAWLTAILRASPAWTTSLAVHTLLLLVLALVLIRLPEKQPFALVLGFGASDGDPGAAATDDAIVEMPGEEAEPNEEPPSEPTEAVAAAEPPLPVEAEVAVPAAPAAAEALPATARIRVALSGRDPGRREGFIGDNGGSPDTEAAVAAALQWIVRQQRKDGQWSLQGKYRDGGSQENRLAATAMALLALQGAGNTHRAGEHRAAVARGAKALREAQRRDGDFDLGSLPPQHALYSHAQATIALCELYGMTRDEELRGPASDALAYALAAQGPEGGWRYEPGRDGDMSVTGWYVMALKSAEMAGLDVPREAFDGIESFLERVATQEGRRYGYRRETLIREASPVTAAVSAEGLLARQYLGWAQDDARIVAGLGAVMGEKPLDFDADKDVYAWYYITQVAHHAQGDAWRTWNARLRAELPRRQVAEGAERGSWDPALDRWGPIGGRLFVTCFCTWMLEVYYRHLPLYGEMPPAGEIGTAAAGGEALSR